MRRVGLDALEARHHRDLPLLERRSDLVAGDDAIRARPCTASVRIGTCQPSQERPGCPWSAGHGQQAGGDLLARGDHGVVFVVARPAPGPAPGRIPGHELVGVAGHGRDHDRHLVAGIDLARSRLATRRMRSTSATDVPPNFITTNDM